MPWPRAVAHPVRCLLALRFARSGRPRKMRPEKLTVVMEDHTAQLCDDECVPDSISSRNQIRKNIACVSSCWSKRNCCSGG